MLKVQNLCFYRSEQPVYNPIDFDLNQNAGLYLTGENGIGKSTVLKQLCGFIKGSGTIVFTGDNGDAQHNNNICYCGHKSGLLLDATVQQNFEFMQTLYAEFRDLQITQLLAAINMNNIKPNQYVSELSLGQQKKLQLAKLLYSNSKLWLLDEPYSALDTTAKQWLNNILAKHLDSTKKPGGYLILTSHLTATDLNLTTINLTNAKLG